MELKQAALHTAGVEIVPGLIIQTITESDLTISSFSKRHNYFETGVQVAWWVYPIHQEVHVYTSLKTVTICTDDDMLSAAPVLPEMQMTVSELLGK